MQPASARGPANQDGQGPDRGDRLVLQGSHPVQRDVAALEQGQMMRIQVEQPLGPALHGLDDCLGMAMAPIDHGNIRGA